ncbi:S1 RNA-binding domain-containing protein [Lentibacillus salinarum]|uniref:S1 RNA-binding domain-containing protein n=1 Tax=Lentibacillus salinarum TaxID=446820 RepID=A0ABW3ZXW7_9BACI
MADERLQVLIEGYDPEKVKENEVDEHWKEIYGAYQNRTILQALVTGIETKLDKPCAVVNIGTVRGYIPLEASGMENNRQLHSLTGKDVAFKVLNYDREAGVFTASRAQALEQMAAITWEKLEKDAIIMAVARTVSPNLVRADIGGIEVKIPVEQIRYGWIDDLTEEVKPGDHFKVKVTELDKENEKVSVSAKDAQQNPWPDCSKRYEEGNEYVGKVSGVREYGVFVNLEPGVDSLSRHLKFQNVHKGDRVLVRILGVDVDKEQIRSRITRIL